MDPSYELVICISPITGEVAHPFLSHLDCLFGKGSVFHFPFLLISYMLCKYLLLKILTCTFTVFMANFDEQSFLVLM